MVCGFGRVLLLAEVSFLARRGLGPEFDHLDRLRCCAVENSEQRETQEDEKTGLGVVFLFQIAKKSCNRTASDLVTKAWMTSTANL